MIKLQFVYALAGAMFAAIAWLSARDRTNPKRWGNAAFWGLMAVSFLAGDRIGAFANGLVVIALALIAGLGLLGLGRPETTSLEQRRQCADRLGARLFLVALIIPAVAVFGSLVLKSVQIGAQRQGDQGRLFGFEQGLAADLDRLQHQ